MSLPTGNVIVCGDGYCLVDKKSIICCAFCDELKDCTERCLPTQQEGVVLSLCTYQKAIKMSEIRSFKPTGKKGLRYSEKCYSCEEILEDITGFYTYDGDKYCEQCFDDTFGSCGYCEETHYQSEQRYVQNKEYNICDYCYRNYFNYCGECDELFHTDDLNNIHDGSMVCNACISNEYTACSDCGELYKLNQISVSDIEAESLCSACWNRKVIECDGCGLTGDKDNMHEVNNEMFCKSCYNDIEENEEEPEGGN